MTDRPDISQDEKWAIDIIRNSKDHPVNTRKLARKVLEESADTKLAVIRDVMLGRFLQGQDVLDSVANSVIPRTAELVKQSCEALELQFQNAANDPLTPYHQNGHTSNSGKQNELRRAMKSVLYIQKQFAETVKEFYTKFPAALPLEKGVAIQKNTQNNFYSDLVTGKDSPGEVVEVDVEAETGNLEFLNENG